MRICMDYQPAVVQRAGIGRYTRVLAEELARLKEPGDELGLFYLDFSRKAVVERPEGAVLRASRLVPGRVLQKLWTRVGFPPFDLFAGRADLYHFTNFLKPPLRRGRSVVTIFDMSFERFPQFAEAKNLRNLRAGLVRTVEEADAIITISKFSADETERFYPASKGKIVPIPLGISPSFAPAAGAEVALVKEKLGLSRPFLLAVGTVEPRKNLPFLVEVFDKLGSSPALRGLDLVVAGMPGWKSEPIFAAFESMRRKDRFHYVKYVPDGMLAALYTAADALVVTSYYEGFGFPPLEAMACGTPVVSSDGGSLPEVLGDAALVVPGFDSDAWAHAMDAWFSDPARLSAASAAGIARAASYRWERTARETWDVYRNVLNK